MSYEPLSVVSMASDLSGRSSPGGVLQWAVRFCQTPESLPVFLAWARSIWPECPYTDAEIAADLVNAHDFVTLMLKSGLLP